MSRTHQLLIDEPYTAEGRVYIGTGKADRQGRVLVMKGTSCDPFLTFYSDTTQIHPVNRGSANSAAKRATRAHVPGKTMELSYEARPAS